MTNFERPEGTVLSGFRWLEIGSSKFEIRNSSGVVGPVFPALDW